MTSFIYKNKNYYLLIIILSVRSQKFRFHNDINSLSYNILIKLIFVFWFHAFIFLHILLHIIYYLYIICICTFEAYFLYIFFTYFNIYKYIFI